MTAISVLLWFALILLLAYRFYVNNIKRIPNFPPGPPRLPFLEDYGLLLLLNYRHLFRAADKLARYYKTKLLGLRLVGIPTIIIYDLAIAREVLKRSEFDGRPGLFLALMRQKQFKRRGIFFTEGPAWKEHRLFFLRHLRDYGFGKRSEQYEQHIESELLQLVDLLQSGPRYEYEGDFISKNGCAKCPDVFFVTIANMFLQLITMERYQRARAKPLVNASRNGLQFLRFADGFGTVYSYFPWVRYVFPFTKKYHKIRDGMLGLSRFFERLISLQMDTLHDPENPRHFIDRYLDEAQNHIPQNADFTFQYDQLVTGLADFYMPAVVGTSVQLSMALERLLLDPEAMQRIQREIDDVVDHDRLPTLNDRINLPYTEATVRECLRIDTLIPTGIVHRTTENTELEGYHVHENTLLLVDFDRINNQQDIWEDPRKFRPDRFLDDMGKLDLSKDRTLSFGIGKRQCPGQTFARNTLFLMLATLLQRFELKHNPTNPWPILSKRQTGLIHAPDDFWIRFVPRPERTLQK
ncbi:probable cytochrome P450 304a1 [Anopheles nili]|uniref:probable cytochrome P450 304a1 n=1 Tax=Anopheles nili TaxID=185578 RepID=UPI00237C5214|nr:probable cytochrome P450 304a1 [Anopheles nili]